MLSMPVLETARLIIRPFEMADLQDAYQLLDVELAEAEFGSDKLPSLVEREEWLRWSVLNYEQLARLYQPPYGDRAVVLKATRRLIGAAGYVPCLMPFEQMPNFVPGGTAAHSTAEFGLFYAISPSYQRQGYAAEAAQALVDYAFTGLHLKRVVATTTYANAGSMGVMHRLGMRIEKNPLPTPPYMQVVGSVVNPHTPA
jgi:[ribosomal protein S5]-alanine N-acetyltransferase